MQPPNIRLGSLSSMSQRINTVMPAAKNMNIMMNTHEKPIDESLQYSPTIHFTQKDKQITKLIEFTRYTHIQRELNFYCHNNSESNKLKIK